LGAVGLVVMAIPQDLALILSTLTMVTLAILAVALTKVNVTNVSSLHAGAALNRHEVEKPHPI
jgi:hypothetical protein